MRRPFTDPEEGLRDSRRYHRDVCTPALDLSNGGLFVEGNLIVVTRVVEPRILRLHCPSSEIVDLGKTNTDSDATPHVYPTCPYMYGKRFVWT